MFVLNICFFFSSRRRHTRCSRDWSSDVCSSDLHAAGPKTSQNITVDHAVTVNGQALKPGDAEVRWVTHSPQATVTFVQRKSTFTADGVFVTRPEKAERDAVVYRINPDGSRSLLELQFAGSNKVLSFDPV